jgi:hypothetical protein
VHLPRAYQVGALAGLGRDDIEVQAVVPAVGDQAGQRQRRARDGYGQVEHPEPGPVRVVAHRVGQVDEALRHRQHVPAERGEHDRP